MSLNLEPKVTKIFHGLVILHSTINIDKDRYLLQPFRRRNFKSSNSELSKVPLRGQKSARPHILTVTILNQGLQIQC